MRILTHGSIAPNDPRQLTGWAQDHALSTLEVSNRQSILLNTSTKIIREDLARRVQAQGYHRLRAANNADARLRGLPSDA